MPIQEHSLYVAGWEHFHLLGNDTPTGLPNQLFSQQPWLLILFEHIYCDLNGLKGEQNAAEEMGWVNSELFVKLASAKYDILHPVVVSEMVRPVAPAVSRAFENEHGMPLQTAVAMESVSVEELFAWRLQGLQPFLRQHSLVLYDWPLARHDHEVPLAVRLAAADELKVEVAAVPLAKDLASGLDPARQALFEDLQRFEAAPLRRLREGRIAQDEYLSILKKRKKDYREIDLELLDGVPQKLERILTLRERFGARGGWRAFRSFMQAYERDASPRELHALEHELREKLQYCFKPTLKEFGPALVKILRGAAKLNPVVHEIEVAHEMTKGALQAETPMRELIRFLRGQTRRQIANRGSEHE